MGRRVARGVRRKFKNNRPQVQPLERRVLLSGQLDPTFGNNGIALLGDTGSTDDAATAIGVVPGTGPLAGELLAGGGSSGGDTAATLARYTAEGQPDTTFGNGGQVRLPLNWKAGVEHLIVSADGSSIGIGTPPLGDSSTPIIEKFKPGGAIDQSWVGPGAGLSSAHAIIDLGSGRTLLVAGQTLAELKPDGSLDPSFGSGGEVTIAPTGAVEFSPSAAALQSNGDIVLAGQQLTLGGTATRAEVQRYTPAGQLDTSFGSGGSVLLSGVSTTSSTLDAISVDPATNVDSIIVGGSDVASGATLKHSIVARLSSSGGQDAQFGSGGILRIVPSSTQSDTVTQLAIESDGSVAVAGGYRSGKNGLYLAHIVNDGAGNWLLDAGFGNGGVSFPFPDTWFANSFPTILFQSGGIILGAGAVTNLDATSDQVLARIAPDGSLDFTFGNGGTTLTDFQGPQQFVAGQATQQSDGKFVMTGGRSLTASDFLAARLNADGTPDTTFGTGGVVHVDLGGRTEIASNVVEQPDGKLVLVGRTDFADITTNFAWIYGLARLNADGTPDTTFGGSGHVITDFTGAGQWFMHVALQPDGSILAEGPSLQSKNVLVRYTPSGQVDSTLGGSGNNNGELLSLPGTNPQVQDMWTTPDGHIMLEGITGTPVGAATNYRRFVARLNPDGTFDTSFGNGGVSIADDGSVNIGFVRAQPDAAGNVYVAGQATNSGTFYLSKLKSDGTLDTSFAAGGTATVPMPSVNYDFVGGEVRPMSDGSFVLAGFLNTTIGTTLSRSMLVAQLTASGQLDTSFGNSGFDVFDLGHGLAQGTNVFSGNGGRIVVVGSAGPQPGVDYWAAVALTGQSAAAPVPDAGGPYSGTEGQTINLSAANSTGAITKYEWDFNYDGNPADFVANATGVTTTMTLPEGPGTITVAVRTTGPGGSAIATAPVQVNDAPLTVDAGPATSTPEGTSVTLTGTFSDGPQDAGQASWTITGPNKFTLTTQGASITFTPPDDGAYTASFTVTDNDGKTVSADTTVTATEATPVFALTGAPTANALVPYTLNLIAHEPGSETVDHWTINWGDGSVQTVPGSPSTVSHTYQSVGSDAISATVTDNEGTWPALSQFDGVAGALDPTFAPDNSGKVVTALPNLAVISGRPGLSGSRVIVRSDGSSVVLTTATIPGGGGNAMVPLLAGYTADGQLDPSFGNGGTLVLNLSYPGGLSADELLQQPDGRLLVAFSANTGGTSNNQIDGLVRLNSNGTYDTGFGTSGVVTFPDGSAIAPHQADVALYSTGKILLAFGGAQGGGDMTLVRLNSDGTVDTTFNGAIAKTVPGGFTFHAVALAPDNTIVAAGQQANVPAIVHFLADGTIDPKFGTGGVVAETGITIYSWYNDVLVQGDGKIVAVGSLGTSGGTNFSNSSDGLVVRYNADGTRDTTFDSTGEQTVRFSFPSDNTLRAVALAGTKILVAGDDSGSFGVARLNADGSQDTAFGAAATGKVSVPFGPLGAEASGLALATDGSVLVSGVHFGNGAQGQRDQIALVRLAAGSKLNVLATPGKIITGSVFDDANFNGALDPGESGMGGVTVFIDSNNNGALDPAEISAVTNPDGSYVLSGLDPGTSYTVREVVPAGYGETAPLGYSASVTAAADKPVAGPVFGNTLLSKEPMAFSYLVLLARHYGKPATFAGGDLDGDGQVGFNDLVILARNYTKTLTTWPVKSGTAAAAVSSAALRPTATPLATLASLQQSGDDSGTRRSLLRPAKRRLALPSI